jgi:PAS domain S-box-containing protein
VLSVVRDITERRQRERELQRSEARLRATVEAAFDCIIGMDGAGRIVEFNAAAERCFGHARSAVLGRLLADVVIPPRLRGGHSDGLRKFSDTGYGPFIGRLVETAAMRADGSEFPIELAISVAAAPDGNIYVGHLRDITERRQAEIQRAELEGQLRQAQKMEAIGQLTGGIAHDFNNILTSVTGYIVLASERAERLGAADVVRQLGQAHLAAQRARDLISQMLAFARRQRSERRPLMLAGEVRQSAQLLRSTLPSSVELHTLLDADAPAVDRRLGAGRAGALQPVHQRTRCDRRRRHDPHRPRRGVGRERLRLVPRAVARAAGSCSRSPTAAAASTMQCANGCSSPSTRPSRSAAARAWGWRWCTASSMTTTATFWSMRSSHTGRAFASCCRRPRRSRRRRSPPRTTSRRRRISPVTSSSSRTRRWSRRSWRSCSSAGASR